MVKEEDQVHARASLGDWRSAPVKGEGPILVKTNEETELESVV